MPYEVVNRFRDTKDPNDKDDKQVIYQVGDQYPREGYEPSEERIEELSNEHPKYKRVFIKEVETGSSKQLTKTDIRQKNKAEQEDLIKEFGGDPGETKNEDERISLILKLQEKNESPSE
ncbi:hypothetical protein SAMN05421743_12142 [Thalassobacillus cyri]|uniref:YqbF C-terminal domain-containing protein n=1 Tax=Thalassobacillus cyri TaxID=571932 RepID=A0A1H4H1R0_9BACI|nr:hypothetical protein [Thalassobacillus cyri]SEB15775.1 hypothetical protein SAMN05421743_12142 [Thalassobacillus cyri]